MAPPCRSLFGSISSTLDWNLFSRMALAWRTMWKSLLSVTNGTTFPPWRSSMTWRSYGALLVDFLFNLRLDTISSLTLLKGMALPWRTTWRLHGAWHGAGVANCGVSPHLCSFYVVFRHVCLPSVGARYAN